MTAYTSEQVERGRRKLYRAEAWRRRNPEAWSYLVFIAKDKARKEQPISGRALIEAAREKAFVDRNGNDSKVNNDYEPIFARWMMIEHPETAQFIERRKTVFDLLIA